MVNWKRIPKIDAHIHLMPPDVIEANQGYENKFVDFGDVDDYIRLMDAYHIEYAFMMPFNDTYMMSMDFKVESVHNNMVNMCRKSRNRLFAFADVDIRNDLKATIQELEQALEQDEFLGVKIHPSNTGYPVDGTYYDGIFKWANKNSVLVEIHSYPRTHILDDVCSPSRIKTIVKKYPDLRISIAHMGGFQYEELIHLGLYTNLSAILPDLTSKFGIEKANEILRQFDIEKLVFATDYPDNRNLRPEEIYSKYFEILEQMDFTLGEAEKICYCNAMKMIGRNKRIDRDRAVQVDSLAQMEE